MVGGKTERSIDVHMVGGTAKIQWREDGEVVINAPAELVYEGAWLATVVNLTTGYSWLDCP